MKRNRRVVTSRCKPGAKKAGEDHSGSHMTANRTCVQEDKLAVGGLAGAMDIRGPSGRLSQSASANDRLTNGGLCLPVLASQREERGSASRVDEFMELPFVAPNPHPRCFNSSIMLDLAGPRSGLDRACFFRLISSEFRRPTSVANA